MDSTQLQALVRESTTLPAETEWVEFKHNKAIPDDIGEYISALANSCALQGKPCATFVWGVEDGTHRIVGTSFRPREAKVGNEELENWLAHHLTPRIAVHMHEVDVDGTPVVLFAVQPATNRPVRFKGTEYIRIGSYKKSCTITRKRSASSGAFSSGHPLRMGWRSQEHRPMMSYR